MGEVRLIKRYANRKLYDTCDKRYITLEQIAQLVREGAEVRVVDNDSGADLTSVTLSQILFEQEKRQAGKLPQSFLTELVKSSSTFLEQVRRTVSSWLGSAHMSEEAIRKHLAELVEKGQLSLEESRRLEREIAERTRELLRVLDAQIEQRVAEGIQRLGLVSRSEVERLRARVDAMAQRIARALGDHPEAGAAARFRRAAGCRRHGCQRLGGAPGASGRRHRDCEMSASRPRQSSRPCRVPGCEEPRVGRSQLCATHLREKLERERREREQARAPRRRQLVGLGAGDARGGARRRPGRGWTPARRCGGAPCVR